MANTRITGLATATSLESDDVLHAVDTSADVDKQVTVETLSAAIGESLGIAGTVHTVIDEFDENPIGAWFISAEGEGGASWAGSLAAAGLPGPGGLFLGVGTASSTVSAARAGTGMVRDTGKPIKQDWWATVVERETPSVVADDECTWFVGMADAAFLDDFTGDAVIVYAGLSGATRTFTLRVYTAGTPVDQALTLTPLGANEFYRIRLTVSPTAVLVDYAIGPTAAFASAGTLTTAVPAGVYYPVALCSKDSGGGDRLLSIGRFTTTGHLSTATSAAGGDFFAGDIEAPATVEYVDEEAAAAVTAANAYADGLVALRVPVSRILNAGAGITGGGVLSADRTFAADFGTGSNKVLEASSAAIISAFATLAAAIGFANQQITDVAVPSASGHAATKGYVDQPSRRDVSGTTDTILLADVGGVVFYSQPGGVTAALPDFAGNVRSGGCMVLTFQATDPATVITVDPGSGVTIDGSTSNYVAPTGRARVTLLSGDGSNWFSGATP